MRHFRFFYILFFGVVLFFLSPFHFTDSFAETKDSLKKDDPKEIINIMGRELTRSMEKLKHKDFEPPYFISYLLREVETFAVSGKYGAINSKSSDKKRNISIDLRVGSYDFDNSNPETQEIFWDPDLSHFEIYNYLDAPIDNDEDALRNALWLLTDFKYKQALSMYAKKKGKKVFEVEKEKPVSDFSKENCYTFIDKNQDLKIPADEWENVVRQESAEFKKYKEIFNSGVSIDAKKTSEYFVNSESSKIFTQQLLMSIGISAEARAEEGVKLDNSKYFYFRSPGEFFSRERIHEEVKKVIDDLLSLRKAQTIDPYIGPAILAPQVTGVFFHEAVGHRLEGERQKNDNEGQTFKGKIGEKIIPPFLTVEDDPTLSEWQGEKLNGYYQFDAQGIPSQKVVLIENGVLKNFILSRTPIEGFNHSNGHGRSSFPQDPMGRMGNLIVRSSKEMSKKELKNLLMEEAKKQGKPFGLIIKDVEGGDTATQKRDFQAFRSVPKLVYKVDVKTGKETLVRGVAIVGTPLISIDKIIASGNDYEVFNGYCDAESGSVPVSTIAPSVLIKEIELQRTPEKKQRPPILPPPVFD